MHTHSKMARAYRTSSSEEMQFRTFQAHDFDTSVELCEKKHHQSSGCGGTHMGSAEFYRLFTFLKLKFYF
jgi:hypothetical protein